MEISKENQCGLMKIELFGNNDHLYISREKGGKGLSLRTTAEYRGGSIMLWEYFVARGTGALHKIDGIMRQC